MQRHPRCRSWQEGACCWLTHMVCKISVTCYLRAGPHMQRAIQHMKVVNKAPQRHCQKTSSPFLVRCSIAVLVNLLTQLCGASVTQVHTEYPESGARPASHAAGRPFAGSKPAAATHLVVSNFQGCTEQNQLEGGARTTSPSHSQQTRSSQQQLHTWCEVDINA